MLHWQPVHQTAALKGPFCTLVGDLRSVPLWCGVVGAQVLQRCLNARQFALKLIANVSYGYTSASFSGRMPCAELADAIVQVRVGHTGSGNSLEVWVQHSTSSC